MEASKTAFEKVAQEVRQSSDKDYTLDEIVYGCVIRDYRSLILTRILLCQVYQSRKRDNVPSDPSID
jgi:hypothetical protein